MNKTCPKDGKQNRQRQNYVPSGPIWGRTMWLDCSVTDAKRELEKFGTVSVLYDRHTYNAKLWHRNRPDRKIRQRNKIIPCGVCEKNVSQIKITFSTDAAGHRMAYDALDRLSPYIAAQREEIRRRAESRVDDDDAAAITNRPPIIKRLTGKERKIAKKRAAESRIEYDG